MIEKLLLKKNNNKKEKPNVILKNSIAIHEKQFTNLNLFLHLKIINFYHSSIKPIFSCKSFLFGKIL